MSVRARPVSRRTAVGATLAGALAASGLVAGCSLDPPSADQGPGAPPEPEPDADVLLVAAAITALDSTAATVSATAQRHPRLATGLRPLADVHATHRAVLDAAAEVEPEAAGTPPVPGRQAVAIDRVRRAETRLAGTLRESASAAQSGDLARALASMAASLTQHLAVLDTEGPTA